MGKPYVRILVDFTPEFRDAVWEASAKAGMTYSEFVTQALETAVAKQGIQAQNTVNRRQGRPRKGGAHVHPNH